MRNFKSSKKPCECFTFWKGTERNGAGNKGFIDAEVQLQIEKERQKYRDVLTGILLCIKFLATHNLDLRGHKESLQLKDKFNDGNFIELLKLLATFDPVTKEDLKYVEIHPGPVSYLSPEIQNEFIGGP